MTDSHMAELIGRSTVIMEGGEDSGQHKGTCTNTEMQNSNFRKTRSTNCLKQLVNKSYSVDRKDERMSR